MVIAIIALLIGILLPALGQARESARMVICMTNERQTSTALLEYANDNKEQMPPTLYLYQTPGSQNRSTYWYNDDIIGNYLPQMDNADSFDVNGELTSIGGGVVACPSHPQGGRSYNVNYWVHSAVDWTDSGGRTRFFKPGYNASGKITPETGRAFDVTVDFASRTMLLIEAWGTWALPDRNNPGDYRFYANSNVGGQALPGVRWGASNNLPITLFGNWRDEGQIPPEFGNRGVKSYIPYYRHDRRDKTTEIEGGINIALMDGHVERYKAEELFNDDTGKSTYEVLWSPIDERVEK